jgi:glycosyltransferase involved in cell wall biosynthesis
VEVTVVVPMHNAEATIGRCLDSIAAQTSPPVRVIAVDDGSTDGTAEVCSEHALAGLEVVRSHVSRGPGAARNDGARRATTDWLAFLDADNVWAPTFLEKAAAGLVEHRAEFASTGGTRSLLGRRMVSRLLDEPAVATERSRDFWRIALRFLPAVPSSMVVARDLFDRAGGFPDDVLTGEDITFAARLWLIADRFAFVNEPLYVSIQRPDSLTAGRRRYRDLRLLLGRVFMVLVRAARRRRAGTRWLAVSYARMAVGRHVLWLRQLVRG